MPPIIPPQIRPLLKFLSISAQTLAQILIFLVLFFFKLITFYFFSSHIFTSLQISRKCFGNLDIRQFYHSKSFTFFYRIQSRETFWSSLTVHVLCSALQIQFRSYSHCPSLDGLPLLTLQSCKISTKTRFAFFNPQTYFMPYPNHVFKDILHIYLHGLAKLVFLSLPSFHITLS